MTCGRSSRAPSHVPSSAVNDPRHNSDLDTGGPALLDPVQPRAFSNAAIYLFWPLLTIFAAVVLIFYILYSPLRVDGDSMAPGLEHGDRLLMTKSYDEARKGDIVILTEPDSDEGIIKRIAAVGGDTIEIRDDLAIVNGVPENEEGIIRVAKLGMSREEMKVPADSVYVLGDNRPVSLDSRMTGPMPLRSATNKAVFIFWPPVRIGPVH